MVKKTPIEPEGEKIPAKSKANRFDNFQEADPMDRHSWPSVHLIPHRTQLFISVTCRTGSPSQR